MRPRVLTIVGPTAVGKTDVAVALARRVNGEVVAADSRQVYRGLRIGSAAPTDAELAAAPHHLVQCVDPRERFTVADFVPAAEAAIAAIIERRRVPLLVVGTGMWLRALLEGWTLTATPADPALRAELAELDLAELHARLAAVDPVSAARLPPADRKRVIRALEVCRATGRPYSAQREAARRPVPFEFDLFGLRRERESLYNRIDRRVEAMLAAGWLDEVRALLDSGLSGDELSLEGLGYRHLLAHLRGELTLAAATEATQTESRRLAKRQMTWFRALRGVRWLDCDDVPPAVTAARIAEEWQADR